MNKCLNCGLETKNSKFCSVGCQNKAQGAERADKTFGALKDYTVKCNTCSKEFIVSEREKLHPQKEKYYCSRSCANKRTHSQETKDAIRKSLQNDHIVKLICKHCEKEFEVAYKKRHQIFCSTSCVVSFRNKNKKTSISKPHEKRKQFNILFKQGDTEAQNKKTFIYSLEYPQGNVRYIGKSDSPNVRLKKHIKEARYRNKNRRDKWINSLPEKPFLSIIEETVYLYWQEREMYWIKFYKDKGCDLVNGTEGGEGSNGFKGMKHTEENKKKFSELRRGVKMPPEIVEKLKGENSASCKIKDDEVREIFVMYFELKKTAAEIAEKFNLNKKYIYQIISGRKRKNIFEEYNKPTVD